MKKRIVYKAIFTSDGQKETVNMEGVGYFYNDPYRIIFDDQGHHIEIECNQKAIKLTNNDALLQMHTEMEIFNNYKLAYGYTHFKTRVLKCEKTKDFFHLKYELFDDVSVITTAYIKVDLYDIELAN